MHRWQNPKRRLGVAPRGPAWRFESTRRVSAGLTTLCHPTMCILNTALKATALGLHDDAEHDTDGKYDMKWN